jgi:CrcB protein
VTRPDNADAHAHAHAHARGPRAGVLLAVFVGGCVGGYARYAVTQAWSTPRAGFPWSTFAVNVAGAFILAVVIVVANEVRPARYLRPLLGTGFCGALTTFSSVVVAAAQLIAHGHGDTAAGYLALTTVAALAAAWFGLVCARAVAAASALRGRAW